MSHSPDRLVQLHVVSIPAVVCCALAQILSKDQGNLHQFWKEILAQPERKEHWTLQKSLPICLWC